MIIRPMTFKDKYAVEHILQNTPEFTPAEVELAAEVINDYLADPDGSGYFVLVADTEPTIAGYICYGPTPITEGTWDIYWIAVNRDIQGRGVGKKLMQAAEEQIRQARGRLILVETSSKMGYEKTNLFYQRVGYKEICRIVDFYAVGDSQIIYEKRL